MGPIGPDPHPWAGEFTADSRLRRRSWRQVPWEDLHVETLVWRGLQRDLQEERAALDEADPARRTVDFAIDYATMRIGDLVDALEDTVRHGPRGKPFPWPPRVGQAQEAFARMKARLDLPDVIEAMTGESLERRGRQWTMCCPLPGHEDADPSFTVSPEKQVWYCHGCHRGGDVFTFVQERFQLVNAGAALRLLQRWSPGEDAR
jgi:hypothetical protein